MRREPLSSLVNDVRQCNPRELGRPRITYLDISCVDNGTKRLMAPQRIAVDVAPSRARQLVHADDVLVSTVRPNLNAVALVPLKFDSEIASTGFCVLRPQPKQLYPTYLFYFTQSAGFVTHLTTIANGASYPAVTDKDILEIRVPLPELSEQRRIARQLEEADRLRRTRRYTLELSDAFLSAAFLKVFSDPSFPSVHLEELASKEKNSFVNGPFGSDLLTNELTDSGVPVVYIRDIASGRYERMSSAFVTPAKAAKLAFCNVKPGDVLVTKVGDPPGIAAVYPETEQDGVVTQDVIRIRPNAKLVSALYLRTLLNSSLVVNEMSKIMVEGTRLRFSLGQFKEVLVPFPPLPLQQKFAALAESVEHLRAVQGEALRQAEHLFNSLLHDAFRTEAEVPHAESKAHAV
jgi:type I restriction enzyme, S subunit